MRKPTTSLNQNGDFELVVQRSRRGSSASLGTPNVFIPQIDQPSDGYPVNFPKTAGTHKAETGGQTTHQDTETVKEVQEPQRSARVSPGQYTNPYHLPRSAVRENKVEMLDHAILDSVAMSNLLILQMLAKSKV